MKLNPRKIAVDTVYAVLKNAHPLSDELTKCRMELGLSSLDMRFVSELASGVIRNLEYLDYHISAFSDIKINKIAPYVLCVLRIGAYQILCMDRIPVSAAVNESVKLIRASSNRRLSGFVNAVLRKIADDSSKPEFPTEEIKRLSTLYSVPEWIVRIWKERLGNDAEKLAVQMNTKPNTVLRVNTLKTTRAELLNILNNAGWECSEYKSPVFPEIDYLITAHRVSDIESLDAYKEGMFYIQDYAGAYVTEVLNPLPGDVVFDMCASPGGKTTHIAQKMQDTGRIFAFDVSKHKVDRINENAARLGISCISAQVMDSSVCYDQYRNTADCVLVDAPCSGLGIIRKKPDIKYLRNPDDSKNLAKISLDILNASASYLKSGGKIVFSTCTTVYEENEGVLFEFLSKNPDFKLQKIICTKENEGYITLYPHTDGCDGFFISLMIKD